MQIAEKKQAGMRNANYWSVFGSSPTPPAGGFYGWLPAGFQSSSIMKLGTASRSPPQAKSTHRPARSATRGRQPNNSASKYLEAFGLPHFFDPPAPPAAFGRLEK